MTVSITKKDVFRYYANDLDRVRRRELEAACRTNAQVRQWFEELAPTEEELERQPLPEVRLDSAALSELAAIVYLSVARDEEEFVDNPELDHS